MEIRVNHTFCKVWCFDSLRWDCITKLYVCSFLHVKQIDLQWKGNTKNWRSAIVDSPSSQMVMSTKNLQKIRFCVSNCQCHFAVVLMMVEFAFRVKVTPSIQEKGSLRDIFVCAVGRDWHHFLGLHLTLFNCFGTHRSQLIESQWQCWWQFLLATFTTQAAALHEVL